MHWKKSKLLECEIEAQLVVYSFCIIFKSFELKGMHFFEVKVVRTIACLPILLVRKV